MTKGALYALAVVLGVMLLGNSVVYGDYTDYIGLRIPYSVPNICIFEAEEPEVNFQERELYNKTTKWIQEAWIDKLNERTDNNNWDVTFEQIPNATHYDKELIDYPQCHVMIVWDNINRLDNEKLSNAQGFTSFDHSKSNHKWSFIDIFVSQPSGVIDLGQLDLSTFEANGDGEWEIPLQDYIEYVQLSDEALRVVVQHEFGHAIGLGHYTQTLTWNYDSLMVPSVKFSEDDEFLTSYQSTEDDIEAMIELYGEAGFKEWNHQPKPRFAYGWVETTTRGAHPITGDFLIKFPDIVWLDSNFGLK